MEEKHTCNCSSKTDDDYLKKLELLAKGSYSERTMKAMYIGLIVFCCILIISISAIATYGINRYYNYLMNTEVVESVEVVEEIISDDYSKDDYSAGGNIIKTDNSNLHNSNLGVDNGNIKNENKKE